MSDWFPPESLSPSDASPPSEGEPSVDERPMREGLPAEYRMRHDRHFVDELDARSPAALIQMVPTKDIQSLGTVDLDEVSPLVESVRKVGVLQPLLVRRRHAGYELIAGTLRFAAATAAGLTELPCRVYNVGEREARALAEADDLRLQVGVDRRPPTADAREGHDTRAGPGRDFGRSARSGVMLGDGPGEVRAPIWWGSPRHRPDRAPAGDLVGGWVADPDRSDHSRALPVDAGLST